MFSHVQVFILERFINGNNWNNMPRIFLNVAIKKKIACCLNHLENQRTNRNVDPHIKRYQNTNILYDTVAPGDKHHAYS